MPSFSARLADGWERAVDHLPLALVPLVLALVQTDKLGSVLAFDGVHVSFKLGIPASVVTVWQFVDPPGSGVTVNAGLPLSAPFAFALVPAVIVLEAALQAGYFGAIADALLDRDRGFGASVGAYFAPFLVVTVLPSLFLLPLALGLFGLGSLDGGAFVAVALVLLPVWLVASYLLWATPYLVVLRQTGLVAAARGSYELAVGGGPYFAYTVGYAGFVLLVSPFVSVVVVSLPLVGLLVGLAGGSVLGLALNFVTMGFVADIDPESPSAGLWTEAHAEADGSPTRDEP